MASMQRARLIPVTGIGSDHEAEVRATSALLAVLTVVREFSDQVLSPMGAPSAKTATVEAFTQLTYNVGGRNVRPDGLVRVSSGSGEPWEALVDVKTGQHTFDADRLSTLLAIAGDNGMDAVVTISNGISPAPGTHLTEKLHVPSSSPAQLHHLPWTAIMSAAATVQTRKGADVPEQAWILGELIRYLKHPESGAMAFDGMGPEVGSPSSSGPRDVAEQWKKAYSKTSSKVSPEPQGIERSLEESKHPALTFQGPDVFEQEKRETSWEARTRSIWTLVAFVILMGIWIPVAFLLDFEIWDSPVTDVAFKLAGAIGLSILFVKRLERDITKS